MEKKLPLHYYSAATSIKTASDTNVLVPDSAKFCNYFIFRQVNESIFCFLFFLFNIRNIYLILFI